MTDDKSVSTHPMISWAIENMQRGCDQNEMFKTMLGTGWSWPDACQFMQKATEQVQGFVSSPKLPSPIPSLYSNAGCPDGQLTRVAFHRTDPEVALIESMVSSSEATALIELGRHRLKRSLTISEQAPMGQQSHPDRSSSGAYLHDIDHPAIAALLARASWMFDWPEERFEGIQILRYLPEEEYKPHHDWFDPSKPGGSSQLAFGGQRVGTVVIYLNDCPRGGATSIPHINTRSMPLLGNAIFFSYACNDKSVGDSRLLHAGEPVEDGEKWVCTLWMRQRRFGPTSP